MARRKSFERMQQAEALKVQRHSGAGPSLLDQLESDIFDHCRLYLDFKEHNDPDAITQARVERGIIRGLAIAIARIRYSPFPRDTSLGMVVKRVEKEWIAKVKQIGDSGIEVEKRKGW